MLRAAALADFESRRRAWIGFRLRCFRIGSHAVHEDLVARPPPRSGDPSRRDSVVVRLGRLPRSTAITVFYATGRYPSTNQNGLPEGKPLNVWLRGRATKHRRIRLR